MKEKERCGNGRHSKFPAPKFSVTVEIFTNPAQVWAVMSDFERWHEWTPSIESITSLDDRPLMVGKRVRIRQPKAPAADWQVTELDPGRSFTWVAQGPGVVASASHEIEEIAGGSRVTLSIRYDGILAPLAAWLTRNLNKRYLNLEAAGLKDRCES